MKRAEQELKHGALTKGERPPGATAVAGAMDWALGKTGLTPPGIMKDLVQSSTREPALGETSFTNLGIPPVPPQEGTAKQIAAGIANVPIGFANFLLSPGGVTTLHGVGLLPRLAQKLVGIGFTAQQVKEFFTAETLQDKITSGIGAALLAGGTASELLSKRKAAAEPAAKAEPAAAADALPGALETTATPVIPSAVEGPREAALRPPSAEPPVTIMTDGIPIEQLSVKEQGSHGALRSQPGDVLFAADETLPFMTKVRIEDELKTRGVTDEQIAALTTSQVQEILAQPNPASPALTSETLSPSDTLRPLEPTTASPDLNPQLPLSVAPEPTVAQGPQIVSQPEITTAAPPVTLKSLSDLPNIGGTSAVSSDFSTAAAEAVHRAELLSDAAAAQASTGPELLDAIVKSGGLPSREAPARKAFAGEIARIDEAARNPQRTERIPLNKIFRSDAPGIDQLATSLRDQGFDVQTPGDLLSLIEQRLTTGKKLFGQPAIASATEGRLFASGSAAVRTPRSDQGKTFAAGAATPIPPSASPVSGLRSPVSPQPPVPPSSPVVSAAVAPLKSWWQARTLGLRKLVAPQTIDAPARMVGNIVRDYNGQLANRIAVADEALAAARSDFDRTPVPSSWKYDPAQPLPRNYAFMAESERGGANLSAGDRALKTQLDKMFEEAVDEVHRVKPAALKTLIHDYFPHIWKDPKAASQAFASIIGTRPLEGSKTFLKQRSLAYIEDGLKMGLKPISDNPIDMVLTKLHEVHKFVAAQDMVAEAKAIGARKFVYIFEKAPEGWVKVEDPSSTVHGPPFVTVPEAFDEQMKVKTIELLDSLGINHERVAKLGGKRWGTYQEANVSAARTGIRTKFAGPLSVYWHELGHGLDERYGWLSEILRGEKPGGNSNVAKELRALADLRAEGAPPNKSFKSYIRSADEKAAVMLEAYMHAPRRMQDVAPVIYGRVRKFIAAHPELKPIEEIRPSLVLGTAKQRIDVGGMVTLGHYYMPEGAATVFNNYLSPGLQRFGIIRNIRTSTNILSGLQLGFSAFHAGFTSIDAAVSQFALALRYASEGKIGKAIEKTLTTPIAPVTNYLSGRAVQRAMLEPGYGTPELQQIAQLAVKAGLRATVDPFWRTQITRNMIRAWNEGGVKGYTGTILRVPFALSEQMMRPILEYLVPRQKLGVFAGMAEQHMLRLGPNADIHAVRDAMARAADATEDRMGQMTYDNLFYNRIIRDSALLGFRAYGWTFGKYRALFGGLADLTGTVSRLKADGPVLTDRMAYLIALPMVAGAIGSVMNYAMTGQAPQDWRDALMPRTGRLDRNGNPQRLSLPTYIKDILSDWHDFPNTRKMLESFSQKLNPWFSVAHDIIENADFFGTKVFNESDPFWKQQADKAAFVARSATPFAVTSTMRLNESNPTLMQQVLPFFGFVPAKAALTMSPAQALAAELMGNMLPRGARTQEAAEHSKLVAELVRDMKEADPGWTDNLGGIGLQGGKLTSRDFDTALKRLPLNPFQFQIKRLSAEDAMKVWDLANPQERAQILPYLTVKIWNDANKLTIDQKRHFQQVLSAK